MRTVMVTKFVPLPDDDGGKQRALAIARRLAGLGELVLCAYDDGRGDRAGLERLGIEVRAVPWRPGLRGAWRGALRTGSVSIGRFSSQALRQEVRQAVEEKPVDLLQIEYLQMAFVSVGLEARRRVLDLHNVESALVASYGRTGWGGLAVAARLEALALRAAERRVLPRMDTVVVVSERERLRLPPGVPQVLLCPNGRDPSPAVLPPSASSTVAFVAALGWAPNADAAKWFCRAVWPEVRRRVGEARLLLVGRDPTPAVLALASSSVEVRANVADVAPFLTQARLTVAPLRSGGGSRLKILEALDAGRPVVATPVGADGLEDLVGRGIVVAGTPRTMAGAVADLLEDPAAAEALGRAGHQAVREGHSWDVALAPLLQAVTS